MVGDRHIGRGRSDLVVARMNRGTVLRPEHLVVLIRRIQRENVQPSNPPFSVLATASALLCTWSFS
jgi:hypothetical protein